MIRRSIMHKYSCNKVGAAFSVKLRAQLLHTCIKHERTSFCAAFHSVLRHRYLQSDILRVFGNGAQTQKRFKRIPSKKYPDSEYLEKSKVPTFHFQKSLPRLPVPDLAKTCQRYLASMEPLCDSSEFEEVQQIVREFQDGNGKVLHNELSKWAKANKHTSYISEPWYDMYLKDRVPIVLNYNPFMTMTDDPRPEYNNQLLRSTNFVCTALRFMRSLKEEVLEPEVYHLNPTKSDNDKFRNFVRLLPEALSWYGAYWYKVFPLDMSQFDRLFHSTRIPRIGKDELVTDLCAQHLLVIHKNRFYKVHVKNENGSHKSPQEIMGMLKHILSDPRPPADFSVGVFTAIQRDDWAKIRDQLLSAGNKQQLKDIDSSMFALILDHESSDDVTEMSRQFLYGNPSNRWFDKSFQLIVDSSAHASINFEHAWGDGVAVLRFFNSLYNETTKNSLAHPSTLPSEGQKQAVVEIEFELNDFLKEAMSEASNVFKQSTDSLGLNYIRYDKFGKDFIKSKQLSPDSFMQLAIQLAWYKMSGTVVGTYESCSTAAFKHGRTETVRPATMATKHTCELFEKGASGAELLDSMKKCSDLHNQLTQQAAMGNGFDRHLFALRSLATQKGLRPKIFEHPAHARLNHIILSTSTLTAPSLLIGGFAPVVKDGFGIGYGVQSNYLGCVVTAYRSQRNVDEFLDSMQTSLSQMAKMIS